MFTNIIKFANSALIADSLTILEGPYIINCGKVVFKGIIDPNLEDYAEIRISGEMIRRYTLHNGQKFSRIVVFEGHYYGQEPCAEKYCLLVDGDCDSHMIKTIYGEQLESIF